jgi:hypothetical protein
VQPVTADPCQIEEFPGQTDLLFGLNITFQVMAITDMSPGYQHAVTPLLERFQDKQGIHAAGAHHPDGPDIGWILEP